MGGFTFALNNVLLRREAHQPEGARALAMFASDTLVSLRAALWLAGMGTVPSPPLPAPGCVVGMLGLTGVFLLSNLALQYGTARLPANATAVIMVSEVLFASVSAVALGAGSMNWSLALRGTLIISASLLAAWRH